MEIVMTRSAERTSMTHVRRDDGVTLELASHAPLHRLPHDLAHFVVERALGLTSGFWGSIADGAVFGGMKVIPRRRGITFMPPKTAPSAIEPQNPEVSPRARSTTKCAKSWGSLWRGAWLASSSVTPSSRRTCVMDVRSALRVMTISIFRLQVRRTARDQLRAAT